MSMNTTKEEIKMKYDYLIVGAGITGATLAFELSGKGRRCLVVDRRDEVGGNCAIKIDNDIIIHKYGPHIFHTKHYYIYKFFTSLCNWFPYTHKIKVKIDNKIYSFPINLETLYQVFGITSPNKINQVIKKDTSSGGDNIEDFTISCVGKELYEMFYYGYSLKQWGRSPKQLPLEIAKRIPIRDTFDDTYYEGNQYQCLPYNYTEIFNSLLKHTQVCLGEDFTRKRNFYKSIANTIIYTGAIDEYFEYKYGDLEYRSVEYIHKIYDSTNVQGISVINYPSLKDRQTRSIEHRLLMKDCTSSKSVVSYEYSKEFMEGINERMYPIRTIKNLELYEKYKKAKGGEHDIIFCGRLGTFSYLDMDEAIKQAIDISTKL